MPKIKVRGKSKIFLVIQKEMKAYAKTTSMEYI